MRSFAGLPIATCLLFMPFTFSCSWAEDVGDIYGGISYSQTVSKDESSRHLGTYKPTIIGIGLSVVGLPNLALDGYVFTGVSEDTNRIATTRTLTAVANDGYGFNLRPFLPLSSSWSLYGKLGRQYGSQETTIRQSGISISTSRSTFAHTIYGAGLSYNFNPQWGVGFDYTKAVRIPSEEKNNSLISIGLRYKF